MDELRQRFPRYSRLLQLYPISYRKSYSQELLQTLADMLDAQTTKAGKTTIWLRTAIDLPLSVTKQQLTLAGAIMTHETPNYIKRSATVGTVLISPFLLFLTLDSLTSHSLYGGFFWHPWIVATWLIFMPAAALIISGTALVRWLIERHKSKVGFWPSLLDWRRNWPVVGIAAVSLGIIVLAFGHDSVHCVVHNPVRDLRYWHTTWTCIRNG